MSRSMALGLRIRHRTDRSRTLALGTIGGGRIQITIHARMVDSHTRQTRETPKSFSWRKKDDDAHRIDHLCTKGRPVSIISIISRSSSLSIVVKPNKDCSSLIFLAAGSDFFSYRFTLGPSKNASCQRLISATVTLRLRATRSIDSPQITHRGVDLASHRHSRFPMSSRLLGLLTGLAICHEKPPLSPMSRSWIKR